MPLTRIGNLVPQYVAKQYGDSICKLIKFYYFYDHFRFGDKPSELPPDGKFASAISRARSMVQEYGFCNPWEYFVTLTLDAKKYDRHDLGKFRKDLQQWVRNERKRYAKKYGREVRLIVLFVPETHKDGAWHLHGWVGGLPIEETKSFDSRLHPKKLVDGGYLNWPRYSKKFGFCSLGKIRDTVGTIFYTCKYISKDIADMVGGKGSHLYIPSRGLERARVIADVYENRLDLDSYLTQHGEFCSTGMIFGEFSESFLTKLEGPGTYFRDDPYAWVAQASFGEPDEDFMPEDIDPSVDEVYFQMIMEEYYGTQVHSA